MLFESAWRLYLYHCWVSARDFQRKASSHESVSKITSSMYAFLFVRLSIHVRTEVVETNVLLWSTPTANHCCCLIICVGFRRAIHAIFLLCSLRFAYYSARSFRVRVTVLNRLSAISCYCMLFFLNLAQHFELRGIACADSPLYSFPCLHSFSSLHVISFTNKKKRRRARRRCGSRFAKHRRRRR